MFTYLTRSVFLHILTRSGAVYKNEGTADLVTCDTISSEILHKPKVPVKFALKRKQN